MRLQLLLPWWLAFQNLWRHGTRTLLTILGVLVGSASVATIIGLGEGVKSFFLSETGKYGTNLIYLVPWAPQIPGRARPLQVPPFTNDTYELLLREARSVYEIEPGVRLRSGVAKWGPRAYACQLIGGTEQMMEVYAIPIVRGRMFTRGDLQGRAAVAVLGAKAFTGLFRPWEDPIGQQVRYNGQGFTIIGVGSSGGPFTSMDEDQGIFIPYTTFQTKMLGSQELSYLTMRLRPGYSRETMLEELNPLLRADRQIADPTDDDFQILMLEDFMKFADKILAGLILVFGAVAGIALVVGSVGLMNILLVSVAERTREIGLRKAMGATSGLVLSQVLIESLVQTGIGGALGVLAGWAIGFSVSPWFHTALGVDFVPVIPATYSLGIVLFLVAVGMLAGLYPAVRASRMNPIQAMQYA